MTYNTVFVNFFYVFYTTKNLCTCIFMTCSTSCSLNDTQVHGIYIYIYVYIYIYTHTHTHTHIHTHTHTHTHARARARICLFLCTTCLSSVVSLYLSGCIYIGVLDNSILPPAFRYMLAQIGPSCFNELCGPHLD